MTKTARKRLLADYRRALRTGGNENACLEGLSERCDSDDEFREILATLLRIMVDEAFRPAGSA